MFHFVAILTQLAQALETGLPERGTRFFRFMALVARHRHVFACQNELRIGIVREPEFLSCPGSRTRMALSARALELAPVRLLVTIGAISFETLESCKTELFARPGRFVAFITLGFRVLRDQLKL